MDARSVVDGRPVLSPPRRGQGWVLVERESSPVSRVLVRLAFERGLADVTARAPLFRLLALVVSFACATELFAQPLPDDAALYHRRTHGGEFPPPGYSRDALAETTETIPATPVVIDRRRPTDVLDNGVDPANLGKGVWIWRMTECALSLGLPSNDVQGVIDQAKAAGMQWITVKCGDNDNIWTQFNADLIQRTHAAGMKIFGWAYVYGGADTEAEINVALHALNLGADGFIIDAETEYEAAGQRTNATRYASAIKAAFPNRFLAHAPFPIISSHPNFPYVEFGIHCDAVMPQAYWADIGGTGYAATMVTRMTTEWRNWQNSLVGAQRSAIKPIAPIGQGYNSVRGDVDGAQITTFMNALKTAVNPATAGGYKGVSFWSFQHQSTAPNKWPAIAAASIGDAPAHFLSDVRLDRLVDAGGSIVLSAPVGGTPPLRYQWRYNGQPLPGRTNATLSLSAVATNQAGIYALAVSNALGGAVSERVRLAVGPTYHPVWSDALDTASSEGWTINRSSADTLATFGYNYAADGIPLAPNTTDGTRLGLKLGANRANGVAAALSLSPTGRSFTGDHRLRFDAWLNVNGPFPAGGAGSTEFITAGIGTAGNRVQWIGTGSLADGHWFAFNGDGGVTDTTTSLGDYAAFTGDAIRAVGTGVYAAGTDAAAKGNGHPYLVEAVPGQTQAPTIQRNAHAQQTGNLRAGAAGFDWHEVIVARTGNTVEWFLDGVRLARITNAPVTAGNVFVGYWDPYASLTDNAAVSFGLIDNARVEIPAVAPLLTLAPTNLAVKLGSAAQFAAQATGTPAPSFQWFQDNQPLPGETNSTLTRASVWTNHVGHYAVAASNVAGSAVSGLAALTVIPGTPAQFSGLLPVEGGAWRFTATGEAGSLYLLETSTNLVDWTQAGAGVATNGVLGFEMLPETPGLPAGFFRARSWP